MTVGKEIQVGMQRGGAALLLALTVVGCEVPTGERRTAEEAVQTVVFQALMDAEGWEGAAAYCLSVGEWETRRDPSPGVLGALPGTPPRVPGSQCTVSATEGTIYRPTGERGQTFHIDAVEIGGSRATARAMWQIHGLGAGGYRCDVERAAGAWRVRACEMAWIA